MKKKLFEDCLEKTVYTRKILRADFLPNGNFPIISQERDFINGYWNNHDDVFQAKRPVIIFGDHTKVIKFVDFDFVLGADGVKILQPIDEIFGKYFYYFMMSVELENLGYARHYRLLRDLRVPIPPLPEQKRIVTILDQAFAAIETAKANTEKNQQNVRELFETFLENIFSNVDDDWEEKKLGDKDLIQIIDGDRGVNYPKKSDFLDHGYCLFLNTKNVRPNGFEFETTMFINEKKDKALGTGKLKRNDVVMTTRGTIGNLGIYNDNVHFDNIRINSGMLIFRPNTKLITPEFLFEILRSGIMKTQISKFVSGAAQPQLPIKTLVNFRIPVPKKISIQQTIVEKLQKIYFETNRLEGNYQQKLVELDELKKSILQKAFNGEL
jgi:type I restriction enzyme S subunit